MTQPSKDLFTTIRRIQMHSTRLANDVLAGAYHSAFKGKGLEFAEVREYQPGDDIRSIDWNVTARMNHPYVKNFKEERELTTILLVDVSASCTYGSGSILKSTMIAEIGAVLAFSAIKNSDRIGLILFSDEVEMYLPPSKGLRHVLHVIRELLVYKPRHKKTNLTQALSFLGKVARHASICFVISDFLCSGYEQEMKLLAKKHDLITIYMRDPFEIIFPAIDLASITDLETGKKIIVDTSSATCQDIFSQASEDRFKKHQKLMKQIGAGFMEMRTDDSYMSVLRKFFKIRELKR